jgi:hypothetical protein
MGRVGNPVGAVLTALVVLSVGQALAQEYCVACSGPDALYRCVIDGAQPRGGQPLQMLCVTAMAKQGGHATCRVTRGTVFDCDAPVKRVPWAPVGAAPPSEPAPSPMAQPAAKPEPATGAGPGPAPAPAPEAPPQTMVDLAKQANEKAAEQMKKAGDSVKDATKKTWDCMFSLFTRC